MVSNEQATVEIPLTRGLVALVDADKAHLVSGYKWTAAWNPSGKCLYAVRSGPRNGGNGRKYSMAREILGLVHGDKRQADHALHNTLDNRLFVDGKENLRISTPSENSCNRRGSASTGYKGVQQLKSNKKFVAHIKVKGREMYLGTRDTAPEASELYVEAAKKYHGRFAQLEVIA